MVICVFLLLGMYGCSEKQKSKEELYELYVECVDNTPIYYLVIGVGLGVCIPPHGGPAIAGGLGGWIYGNISAEDTCKEKYNYVIVPKQTKTKEKENSSGDIYNEVFK